MRITNLLFQHAATTVTTRARRPTKAALSLTDAAAKRLSELLSNKSALGIRLGVRRRGCNGLSYTMDYATEKKPMEEVVEQKGAHAKHHSVDALHLSSHILSSLMIWSSCCSTKIGVKVFIEPKALMFVVGTEMDFVEDKVRSEFVFKNPNAKGSCGCGESFNV
eukprot:GEZU01009209.1.p1 GENE.GEZU01009209.1~~GEZU01009209.1.p1  ORF type:complete len:164 (+),score=3.43 GEZU01009209.1:66-557(+)